MESHDTGIVFTQKIRCGRTPFSFCAFNPQKAPLFVEQSCQQVSLLLSQRPRTLQVSSMLGSSSNCIREGIPTCLFLEKTISVLSYSLGIFYSSLTSSLGKVGPRVLQMFLTAPGGWMGAPTCRVPHFHLSSLLTRNLVVKIIHSLYSELKLRAAIRGRVWI